MDYFDMYPCQICGNPKAKRSYNNYVCNACRIFFSRNYSKSFALICPESGNCVISYKTLRVNCTPCRLRKCLEAHMSKSEEGKSVVEPLYLAAASSIQMRKMMEMYSELMNSGLKMIGNLKGCKSVKDWVDRLTHYDSRLIVRDGPSPSSVAANKTLSLTDLLMYPGTCLDRSTKPAASPVQFKLAETLLRIIVAAIEQMALIEEFHLLPLADKIKLVQQNGGMLGTCTLQYIRHAWGWSRAECVRYLERFRYIEGIAPLWKTMVALWTSSRSVSIDEVWRETQPTEKEFIFLRTRSYFTPAIIYFCSWQIDIAGVDHSDDGYPIIIKTRVRLAQSLAEYIREEHPNFSEGQVQWRLAQLIKIETLLKQQEIEVNNCYVSMIVQGLNEMSSPLLHDIYVRRY